MNKIIYIIISVLAIQLSLGDLMETLDVSKSGMQVQNVKMKAIAENISNLDSTGANGSDTYQKKKVIIKTQENNLPEATVVVEKSKTSSKVYDPSNPDADQYGFVKIPDISLSEEMSNLAMTSKVYEANLAAYSTTKKIIQSLINIGK